MRGVPGSSSQLERLRLLPDIGSRRSRRSARDPMIQRVSSSCTHVISRISKTVGRFPKRLGGSPRNAGTDRTVQMWHVWHDVGKKGSRARALGRRYFVLIWPRRCVVAWVAREREARFAKFRAGVLGSRVVVQARRTWWLAAPRGFSPTARRANPQNSSNDQYHRRNTDASPLSRGLRQNQGKDSLSPAEMRPKASGPERLDPAVENLSGGSIFTCPLPDEDRCGVRPALTVLRRAQVS